MDDQELENITKDPRYVPAKRKVTKKTRTVKDLFKDVDEEITFKDKRGRPWVKNPKAYVKSQINKSQKSKTVDQDEMSVSDRSEESDKDLTSDEDMTSDGDSSSSSDREQNVDVFESIADLQGADWYELTKDSVQATKSTRRLALMHFDWDNAKPDTIYMILESFLPARGHIEKVTIYPSEFGIQRLAEEAVHGPPELRNIDDTDEVQPNPDQTQDSALDAEIDDKSGWRKASLKVRQKIREYQLARLKYFYAIIEFDSPETAEAVYAACDGLEYESSGSRLDLRFVDDDQVFSVAPEHAHLVTECREINKAKYAPRLFETSALHSTRIGITWDKTPTERTNWLRDQFKPDVDLQRLLTEDRDELGKYLALSSSGASTAASSDVESEPPAPTVPRIHRHRPRKVPPAEVRLALLGLTNTTDDHHQAQDADDLTDKLGVAAKQQPSHDGNREKGGDDEEEEEEEEILDLAETDPWKTVASDNEEYDLRPVEKKVSKQMLARKDSKKKVKRKILPEAMEDEFGQISNSSDFDDDDDDNDLGGKSGQKTNHESPNKKKRAKKLKQRAKMLEKKRKVQERLKRQSKLWFTDDSLANPISDDRFDDFLKNSAFQISQTHPDYKEAADFLRFMHLRKSQTNPS